MVEEILVILMVAFGLFALSMFVLFYVYLKRSYNNKHLENDYTKDNSFDEKEEIIVEQSYKINDDEYIPKKKK